MMWGHAYTPARTLAVQIHTIYWTAAHSARRHVTSIVVGCHSRDPSMNGQAYKIAWWECVHVWEPESHYQLLENPKPIKKWPGEESGESGSIFEKRIMLLNLCTQKIEVGGFEAGPSTQSGSWKNVDFQLQILGTDFKLVQVNRKM